MLKINQQELEESPFYERLDGSRAKVIAVRLDVSAREGSFVIYTLGPGCEEHKEELKQFESTLKRHLPWGLKCTPLPIGRYYDLKIDGDMFKAQRSWLLNDVADDVNTGNREGLINLLDEIADQAHDKYGIDCLLCGGEDDNDS